MSHDPNAQTAQSSVGSMEAQAEQARRQVNQLAEEIAQLAEAELAPAQFYSEFLKRLFFAVQGYAAVIWTRTPQGNLVLQCQINLREVGLDNTPEGKLMHDELLRQAALQSKGGIIRPRFSHNFGDGGEQLAGNPTDYVVLLVPILYEKQVIGILEIWQDPNRPAITFQNVHQFMVRMASFVSVYNRNHQLRQMTGQQELWLRLETFARQIHGSMHVTEVAYIVANEGRRMIEVDRVSVATRSGGKSTITAISGADVVEKRSNLVQLMRALADAVIDWGERLVYTGTQDDTLPPKVLHALDGFLAESNSKVLAVMPLQDEREKESKKKPRSALVMECFETELQTEQLMARLDVVGRHAAPALYNALEYQRIPMRFLWLPLAYVQDGLGGKAKAITSLVLVALTVLVMSMIFVPFPLKMEANGQALPIKRGNIFTPIPGKVTGITAGLVSGKKVVKDMVLMEMFDVELAKQIVELQSEISLLDHKIGMQVARAGDQGDKGGIDPNARQEAIITRKTKSDLLEKIRLRTNASLLKPGTFQIRSPMSGIILTADFRENLLGRHVKPSDPLIRIGSTDTSNPKLEDWEIELKIPQKHYGQVARAFANLPAGAELDVDVLFRQDWSRSYRAKLKKSKIAAQANPQKDDNNEPESVVLAWARISGDDIPSELQIPAALLLSGGEVRAYVRCGDHPMGYSLFYGVHEFLYEKIIFPYWK